MYYLIVLKCHTKLQLRCWQDHLLSGGSREESVPSEAFSSFYKLPIILGLQPPSSVFKASNNSSSPSHAAIPLAISPYFPLPLLRTSVIHWVYPDNSGKSPHLKNHLISNLSTTLIPLCHVK